MRFELPRRLERLDACAWSAPRGNLVGNALRAQRRHRLTVPYRLAHEVGTKKGVRQTVSDEARLSPQAYPEDVLRRGGSPAERRLLRVVRTLPVRARGAVSSRQGRELEFGTADVRTREFLMSAVSTCTHGGQWSSSFAF